MLLFCFPFVDIDLISVSSYSDDDEDSSLSDSEYIIVPMPDCFDLHKPLRDLTISSYSNTNSVADMQEFSLDDNHNNLSPSKSCYNGYLLCIVYNCLFTILCVYLSVIKSLHSF